MPPDMEPSPPPDSRAETAPEPALPAVRALRPRPEPISWAAEVRLATAFLTRLPVRLREDEARQPLSAAVRGFPVVGVGIGIASGAIYTLLDLSGLPSTIAALVTVAASVALTGGLHEDGLADTADGLGGGRTREQKLAIMRDSRIGSHGVVALVLALGLRASALAQAGSFWEALLLLIAVGAASRACLPTLMYLLPPARMDGLGWDAGLPDHRRVVDAGALGVIVPFLALGLIDGAIVIVATVLGAAAVAWIARRQIGGATGDVLGAAQQAAEIAALVAFLATPIP